MGSEMCIRDRLHPVSQVKYLGVIFDSKVSFTPHVSRTVATFFSSSADKVSSWFTHYSPPHNSCPITGPLTPGLLPPNSVWYPGFSSKTTAVGSPRVSQDHLSCKPVLFGVSSASRTGMAPHSRQDSTSPCRHDAPLSLWRGTSLPT